MLKKELLRNLSLNLVKKQPNETYVDCIRKNLDIYIQQRGVTISKLAEEADISMETLKTILYGKAKSCNVSTAAALANALGITIDELVGNMEKQTSLSLRTYQLLPDSSKKLIDWYIYHQHFIQTEHPAKRSVSIMLPLCSHTGNLKMTNEYETYDISHLDEEYYYRVFCGVKIPCHHYIPHFLKGDILLIANDRMAKNNEYTVIIVDGNVAVTYRKIEKGNVAYYGIRDNQFRSHDNPKIEILGYVAKVIKSK